MKLIYFVHKYDVFIFNRLIKASLFQPLTLLARYISKTGNGSLYVLLGAYLYLIEGLNSAFLKTLLLAFLIERPLYFVMKNGFKRDRPAVAINNVCSLVTPADQFSFPSGHTSAAFMVAAITGFYIPVLLLPLLIWSTLVGYSRILLGVHFLTDTLVGMILGSGVAIYSINQMAQ